MLKVVIIDDEPIIVEGLTNIIEWEKKGCTIVGSANNGVEGLKLISEKKPDILISDIAMPMLDGLTMIAAIRSQFPEMLITILTGYRDFDYAQKAISLGVCRFLLKPSKMKELEESVDFMINKAKEQMNHPIELTNNKDQLSEHDENDASSFVVKKAIEYMEEHYEEKLMLSEVAEHIFVSQWHLSKLLNKFCGKNFSEILNTIRIDRAKELLGNPEYRISDLTEMVGFSDVAHFSRVFKKMEGISPNEYRNTKL